MKSLLQDIRFGLRMLRKSPGFTAVAIITLALGIGANTAIFSLINAIMLRTLPVRDPQSLVILTWTAKRPADAKLGDYFWGGCPGDVDIACSFSYPMFQQIRAEQRVFSDVFAFLPARFSMRINGRASQARGLYVSGDFFSTLGVHSAFGRLLTPLDDSSAAPPAVVISYRLWRNALGGDPEAVGKSILIRNSQFTIVGIVLPPAPELDPGVPTDFWLPLSFRPTLSPQLPNMTAGNAIWLQLMARLKPGVTSSQAASALTAIFSASTTTGPEAIFAPSDMPRIELPTAIHGLARLRHAFSQPLYALLAAVALTLLIACANIAGLMLARCAARRKEIAMRSALGATRTRIMRQLLTESLLLSVAGGAVGVLLGYSGAAALAAFLSRNWWIALQLDVHPDSRVLAFTITVSVFVGLLFGLTPAFSSKQVDLVPALKEGTGSSVATMRRGQVTASSVLVVVQMALAVLVLVGAGLLVRTLSNLKGTNLGFEAQNLILFGLDTTYTSHPRGTSGLGGLAAPQSALIYRELQEQLATLPGVASATYSEVPLLSGGGERGVVFPQNEPGSQLTVDVLPVAAGFFRTMQIPLLAGRSLNSQDLQEPRATGSRGYQHVVINGTLARRLFGRQNPIGQHFRADGLSWPLSDVVGVVGDAKYGDVRGDVMPTIYAPIGDEGGSFEVRTALAPEAMMSAIRAAVSRFDPNLLITDMKTQEEQIDQNIYQERLIANLSSLFALLALIVACVGIYGMLSYQVTRRTQEIGIRLALGARRSDVLSIVLRQGAVLAVLGVLIGVAAALAVTRYLQSFLFGVKPSDPATIVAVAFGLIAVALLASYIPARRAMKTDPMVALRYE